MNMKQVMDYVHPNYLIFAIFLGFLGVLMMFSSFPIAKMFGGLLIAIVLIILIVIAKDISDEKIPLRK